MLGRVGIKIPPPWNTNANANANIQNWKEGWFIKIKQIDKLLCFTVMAFQFHVRNYRTKICVINKNVASNRFSKTSYP